MTNPDYTHIAVVLDRSGSMSACEKDMRNGLDAFFKSQAKLPGKCLVDFAQFDTVYETVYTDREISEAKTVLHPRGLTALVDAIGHTITNLGEKLKAMAEDDRPGTVIVVVVTDGGENASKEWTAERVKELIEQQTNQWNWNFTFLGANIDAVKTGQRFGFSPDQSLTYDTGNIGAMSASLNSYTTQTRSGVKGGYTEEDRKANA